MIFFQFFIPSVSKKNENNITGRGEALRKKDKKVQGKKAQRKHPKMESPLTSTTKGQEV